MIVAAAIFGPEPLRIYPVRPVTGATVQEKVLPVMFDVKFISWVFPPEQIV